MTENDQLSLSELIQGWQIEVLDMDGRSREDWFELHSALAENQYAYIKFGLLLERIRRNRFYQYLGEKLSTFKDFVVKHVKLSIWQANSYIDAAKVACYLAGNGFEVLPKNFAQASSLIKAYQAEVTEYEEHPQLLAAWEKITTENKPSEITMSKIQAAVDPNWEEKKAVKLNKNTLDRAKRLANERGMTLEEFMHDLMDGVEEPPVTIEPIEFTTEDIEAIEQLDLVFKATQKSTPKPTVTEIASKVADSIDDIFTGILGSVWKRKGEGWVMSRGG